MAHLTASIIGNVRQNSSHRFAACGELSLGGHMRYLLQRVVHNDHQWKSPSLDRLGSKIDGYYNENNESRIISRNYLQT
jgi:hypothetical protein